MEGEAVILHAPEILLGGGVCMHSVGRGRRGHGKGVDAHTRLLYSSRDIGELLDYPIKNEDKFV